MSSRRTIITCVFVALSGAIVVYVFYARGKAPPASNAANGSVVRRDVPPPSDPCEPLAKLNPITLKDDSSGTLFYFESDGQNVAALDKEGNVLWQKNPADEAALKGWKKGDKIVRPVIIFAGPPLDWMLRVMKQRGENGEYISIGFSTKEFGLLDKQTGKYTSMGSD